MAPVRLISLNIEFWKHLDTVVPFLVAQNADVVCLQEVGEANVDHIAAALGMRYIFSPTTRLTHDGVQDTVGIAIFSRHSIERHEVSYYTDARDLPATDTEDVSTYNNKLSPILICDVRVLDEVCRVATTHFTWTPDGSASEEQRHHMTELLRILASKGQFVLCGDFNAPRGGEIFALLSSRYVDNIPPQYATSIDIKLHRAGMLRPNELSDKMVDVLFTTPAYECSNVRLESGVSDHMAIVAEVRKK